MVHDSLTSELARQIDSRIAAEGGWMSFDRFMEMALYTPGLGYYANGARKFGLMPQWGSDFATAPQMGTLFARTLARQVAEALGDTGDTQIWEFGAGSGALASQLIDALLAMGMQVDGYTIVELSGGLRERQRAALARHGDRVQWVDALPDAIEGVILGNEVLDAMPVKLLHRIGGAWHERGVRAGLAWEDRPTHLRPPLEIDGEHDYLTEIHPQAEAFIATLADKLLRSEKGGAAFFADYGFPEAEYYHPQRHMGTLMCHRGHLADTDPLSDVGLKDITAHVDFTRMALAAQDAGLGVLGYTSQARFLINCGLPALLENADARERSHAHKLMAEHEMGELFKVIGFYTGEPWEAMGFAEGDRTHTL